MAIEHNNKANISGNQNDPRSVLVGKANLNNTVHCNGKYEVKMAILVHPLPS